MVMIKTAALAMDALCYVAAQQQANLYVTANSATPGGRPINLVNLGEPDLERFPLFAAALKVAQVANLAPGDALYLPKHWWHNVESVAPLNVLVNFWWNRG